MKMKFKVGDYVIYERYIYKIVHVNKWFRKYNLSLFDDIGKWFRLYNLMYSGIVKAKEKELKGLITFET